MLGVKLLRVDKPIFGGAYEEECFDMLQTCCGGYKGIWKLQCAVIFFIFF